MARGLSRAGSLLQRFHFISFFPGKVGVFAAKVSVGCGLAVNRAQQIEVLDDRADMASLRSMVRGILVACGLVTAQSPTELF